MTYLWKSLLLPFYTNFAKGDYFFTCAKGLEFVNLSETILRIYPENLPVATQRAVDKVYQLSDMKMSVLPEHIISGLLLKATQKVVPTIVETNNERELCVQTVAGNLCRIVSPYRLSNLMHRSQNVYEILSANEKYFLLDYLCQPDATYFLDDQCYQDNNPLLEGLLLLPLANGSFRSLCSRPYGSVYVCYTAHYLELFPLLKDRLCFVSEPQSVKVHLESMAEKGNVEHKKLF